ncbi:MAG TPA: ATP-binding protein, partial [Polyangia bacterium]|nr:ATP-binding protein [Polyangia bacterium]
LLKILLENLLGNAWKFTSRKKAAQITFGYKERGAVPRYCVSDNGAGFDMAHATRLFGAFQRLHAASEFEGAGIGLAAVQRVVRRHHGQVWGEAKVDGGATFTFTLGASPDDSADVSPKKRPA